MIRTRKLTADEKRSRATAIAEAKGADGSKTYSFGSTTTGSVSSNPDGIGTKSGTLGPAMRKAKKAGKRKPKKEAIAVVNLKEAVAHAKKGPHNDRDLDVVVSTRLDPATAKLFAAYCKSRKMQPAAALRCMVEQMAGGD